MSKVTVQWYCDEGGALVFAGDDCIARIPEGNRDEVTKRLRLLGWKPKRWRTADWGYESALTRESSGE